MILGIAELLIAYMLGVISTAYFGITYQKKLIKKYLKVIEEKEDPPQEIFKLIK
jgi:hypothetical protein